MLLFSSLIVKNIFKIIIKSWLFLILILYTNRKIKFRSYQIRLFFIISSYSLGYFQMFWLTDNVHLVSLCFLVDLVLFINKISRLIRNFVRIRSKSNSLGNVLNLLRSRFGFLFIISLQFLIKRMPFLRLTFFNLVFKIFKSVNLE